MQEKRNLKSSVKVFVAVVFFGMAITSAAQEASETKFRVGGIAGMNLSNFYGSDMSGSSYKATAGMRLGVVGEYSITSWFAVSPELLFAQKGAQVKESLGGGEWAKFVMRPCYLQIPINAMGRYKINDDLSVFGIFGPYLGFGLGGNYIYKDSHGNKEKNQLFGKDSEMRRFDFGLTFGAGAEWKNIFLRLSYEFGLVNLAKDVSMKNGTFNVSVGYYFLIK